METPVDELPAQTPARKSLLVLLLVIFGLGLGCAASVGFLLWWDRDRRERWEVERLESLAEWDKRAKAAKQRDDSASAAGDTAIPKDQLGRLNEHFRDIYRIVRAETLAQSSPLVVVAGDDLVLVLKGDRQSVRVLPPLYHELKAYAHIPMAAYLITGLEPGNIELPASRQLEMKKFLERLPDVRQELSGRDYPQELRQRQERLIDETATFLEACHQRAFEKKLIDAKERTEFAAKLREPIMANVRDAAQAQIDALDQQMSKWRKELSDDEWKQLRVIVIGSAMPRKNNVAVQYFAWLLGERGEDKRIIYAESLFEEPKALNLLGTHLVDTDIGRAFFAEPTRLRRDLLGDDAERILEGMKKK